MASGHGGGGGGAGQNDVPGAQREVLLGGDADELPQRPVRMAEDGGGGTELRVPAVDAETDDAGAGGDPVRGQGFLNLMGGVDVVLTDQVARRGTGLAGVDGVLEPVGG